MKGSKDKTGRAAPVELGEKELGDVAGGYELKPVYLSSYQSSASGDSGPDIKGDRTLDVITAAGPGGGPHVKVFSG